MQITWPVLRRGKTGAKGFTLVEVIVWIFIVALAALGYCSLMPSMHRSHKLAKEEATATKISSRILGQIQMMRPSELTTSNLTALGLIDTGQFASPYSINNLPLDDATRYSPSKALPNGQGTMTLSPIELGSVKVELEIRWTSTTGTARSIRTGTIVGGYR